MAATSEAQILGASIKALIAGLDDRSNPILARYGYSDDIDENDWYPRQDYLAMVQELASQPGLLDLVAVGLQTSRYAPMPPHINSLDSALENIGTSYRIAHRNIPEEEVVTCKKIDEHTYYVVSRIPYPPNLEYGLIFGLVERFVSPETRFSVFLESEDGYPAYRIVLREG